MSSLEITTLHQQAARTKARRERLVTDWRDVVAAIHQEVISITDEFNTAPGYSGHQVSVHRCDRPDDLNVTTKADASLKWSLVVNGATRQFAVTCTTPKLKRTTGAPRFNDADNLVVDEVVDGQAATEMTPRAFVLHTLAPLLAAVAER
ncbi:MAG: hypothetical protein M3P06_23440 [Acidobacteriota bacterium]|nr:hypothetical protein [Acidobacteriota bacterium]